MASMVTVVIMGGDRLVIDMRSAEPSYRQLAAQLRERIRDGRIGPGDALPSITYLTGETGLAVQTVRRGIAVLVEEGWAYTVPGRGTYAAEKPPELGADGVGCGRSSILPIGVYVLRSASEIRQCKAKGLAKPVAALKWRMTSIPRSGRGSALSRSRASCQRPVGWYPWLIIWPVTDRSAPRSDTAPVSTSSSVMVLSSSQATMHLMPSPFCSTRSHTSQAFP
jgi:hypothetical protein